MKKLILLLSALLASTAGAGGIAVTNGRTLFSQAGITVQYRPELTVQKVSETMFDISNTKLVRGNEQVSRISFTVTKAASKTLGRVRADLAKQFPGKEILEITQPGARGYYWEERSSATLFGHYDLLTGNGDLVDISLEAYAAADGINLVAPIVHSFVYDNSAPVILETKLDNQTWEAGTPQKLHLRITDDYSGIHSEIGLSLEAPGEPKKVGSRKAYYYFSANLIPEGGDWFVVEVPINKFTPNRKFRINAFNLIDEAGNRRRYEAELNDDHYAADPAAPGAQLPTVRMKITNRGQEDATPPRLIGFRPDTSVWEVGSTHRVYFKLVDDVSGVSLNDKLEKEATISQPCSEFTINKKRFCSGRAGVFLPYRAEGNDWYSVEYKVGDYLPSGEYRINAIVVNDKAGNNRMLDFADDEATEPGLVSSFKIQIQNSGVEDVTSPAFSGWKLDASSWKITGKGKVYVKTNDDEAGLDLPSIFVGFKRLDGAASPSIFTKNKVSPESIGDGWYSLDIELSEYLQAGTYYPSFVRLSDKAGNDTMVDCGPDGSCQVRDGEALKLAPQHVEFIR